MCKHIRLVLVELGIEKDPGAWHQVPFQWILVVFAVSASRTVSPDRRLMTMGEPLLRAGDREEPAHSEEGRRCQGDARTE